MSYNISDINKLKSQIKQYYSFIKNDGMILTNFAKYLLTKTDMNLEQAIINLKEMSIKDIQTKLYDLTLELNTQTEISDIIKNKIDEENKKLKDVYSKVVEYVDLHKKYKIAIDNQINKTKKLEEEYKSLEDTELKKINDYKEYHKLLKDTSEKELITIKNTIDGIYKNEIYDKEYTFEESKYIIKEPMIHLDVDKILEDLKNSCCEIKNISEDILIHTAYKLNNTGCMIKDNNCKNKDFLIKFNFPSEYKINDNEYIIKIYINTINNTNGFPCFVPESYRKSSKKIFIIYITNYGRIIKSQDLRITPSIHKYKNYNNVYDNYEYTFDYVDIKGLIIDNNIQNYIQIGYGSDGRIYGSYPQQVIHENNNYKTELIEQPKLNYRIPRLFIDVIDAFHTQNTDLMQKCCKTYLEISRESKIKDSILKDLELNNKLKEKDNIIKSKDLELEDKNKVIESQQEEINKLKDELTKFKQSLSMLINK